MKKQTNNLLFWGILAALAFGGGAAVVTLIGKRGIRNHNPGNIRLTATRWVGQVAPSAQTDTAFVQFTEPKYGIRAIAKILDSYAARGINTVQSIINTWAPPVENDTVAYIQSVARGMGVSPTTLVTDALKPALIARIIQHENGEQPYTMDTIRAGVALA